MKSAIGNSMLFYIVIFFIILIMLFFVGILSYSKAYKAKNRIIEIIEKNGSYEDSIQEISNDLDDMGYAIVTNNTCDEGNENVTTYKYCVYLKETKSGERYYKVQTFIHFDFPIIGGSLNYKVSGETKMLNKDYEY